MAMVPRDKQVAILTSETTIYTAFIGSTPPTWAQLMACALTNTTGADITIDVYHKASGGTKTYLAKTMTVTTASTGKVLRAMPTITSSGDKWCAVASATGIDCVATIMENAS